MLVAKFPAAPVHVGPVTNWSETALVQTFVQMTTLPVEDPLLTAAPRIAHPVWAETFAAIAGIDPTM
jgi:hypothetical protein